MGRAVVDELRHTGRQVVVVDSRVSRMQALAETGVPTVSGDATLEVTLLSAKPAARAWAGVLSERRCAQRLHRADGAHAEPRSVHRGARNRGRAERRILQAGANRVVNPYHLGGARLAHLVVKPAIVNFFDASVDGSELRARPDLARPNSSVVGKTLSEANVRQGWGLSVVAVQRGDDVVSSPPADFGLRSGDVLVVFGSRQQIAAFDIECG